MQIIWSQIKNNQSTCFQTYSIYWIYCSSRDGNIQAKTKISLQLWDWLKMKMKIANNTFLLTDCNTFYITMTFHITLWPSPSFISVYKLTNLLAVDNMFNIEKKKEKKTDSENTWMVLASGFTKNHQAMHSSDFFLVMWSNEVILFCLYPSLFRSIQITPLCLAVFPLGLCSSLLSSTSFLHGQHSPCQW